MATKKNKIHIKPSKRGSLRKAVGAKEGEKLSVSDMRSRLESASPAMKKKLIFALNARKWNHREGGPLINIPQLGGPIMPQIGMDLSKVGLSPMQMNPVSAAGGSGFKPSADMFSAAADLGSGLIDAFATPDYTDEALLDDRYANVNTGASAGKGALKGAAAGAAAGSIVPGIGTAIGAGVGAIAGGLSGLFGGRKKEKQYNERLEKNRFGRDVRNRLASMAESPSYLPVARQGGFTVYKGETHEGPTGGILTDEQGNPSNLSNNNPIALTENDEVARFDPNTNSTYIYSDSLGFAKEAKSLVNKYKLDKDSWNNLYKNDLLLQTAVDKQFDNLTTAQEFAKNTKSSAEESLGMFKEGGSLTAYKAKKMLKDGMAKGKRLTPRQKRYFNWIAYRDEGGPLRGAEIKTPLPEGATPIYAREYGPPVSFNPDEAYLFQPDTPAANNYFYPENVIGRAGQPNVLPSMGRNRGFTIGYTPYEDRTDLIPAGGYNVSGADTTFYRLQPERLPDNRTVYNYNPTDRRSIGESMNLVRTGSPITQPEQSTRLGDIDEYYKAIGQPVPRSYAIGGPLPRYVRGGNPSTDAYKKQHKENLKTQREFNKYYRENLAGPYSTNLVTDAGRFPTPGLSPGIPYTTLDPVPTTLDIPAAPVIKREEAPIPKPPTVGGVGRKVAPVERVGPIAGDMSPMFASVSPIAEYSKALRGIPSSENTPAGVAGMGESVEANWLNPLGHLLSGVGSISDYLATRRAAPEHMRLPRIGAEQISLARARLMNERAAAEERATNVASARGLGMNAGATFSNLAAANTGVSRVLGQKNLESLMAEETANAQMRQQAEMINAEMAAQESMMNTQMDNAYRLARARMNPLSTLSKVAASYFADDASYRRGFDTLQMLSPNAELYLDQDANRLQEIFGKRKIRFKDNVSPKATTKKKE